MPLLDHEQFDGAVELAEINRKIAEGRALIADLHASKDTVLEEQERAIIERVQRVLTNSHDLLRRIGDNHDELVKYRRETEQYVSDLRYFVESVMGYKRDFDLYANEQHKKLDAREQEIEGQKSENQKLSENLKTQSGDLAKGRAQLSIDQRRVIDGWETLKRATEELKTKKKV